MATESPANGVSTTLAAAITNTATALSLASATGFPNGQYTCLLSDGTNAELVEASALAGATLTVARATETWAGSATAYAFGIGTKVTIVTSVQSVKNLITSYAGGLSNYAPSGLTGATAPSRYVGATTGGAPVSGTWAVGDFVIDQSGQIWICTTAGTPGTWTKAGGGATLPTGVLAYVANDGSNNVSVVEVATNQVIYTIPVGTGPFDVAVTPDGSLVYVANDSSNNVSVIATASNTVTATVTVGSNPFGVAVASSNIAASSAVVTSQGASLATAVTLTASATTTVMSLTLAPGTWVVVSQVDLLTAAVSGGKYTLATTLPVGPSPAGSVFVDETATASEITLSLTQVVTISAAATYNITVTNSTATAATAQIANTGYTAWMI